MVGVKWRQLYLNNNKQNLKSLKKKKIKNMNNKVATSTHLSTIESKRQNKQAEQKQNHRYREHLMVARWEGVGGWAKSEGIKKYKLVVTG